MSKLKSNTIALLGNPIIKEGAASSSINPGYLVEFGGANDLQAHSTAAANARKAFALENDLIGRALTDAYTIGENVLYGVFMPGQVVNALVAASAPAIVIGDALESAGDGTVRKAETDADTDTSQRDAIVGYAIEAVDNSSGGSEARLKLEVT